MRPHRQVSRRDCEHTTPSWPSKRQVALEKLVIDADADRSYISGLQFVWIMFEPVGPHPGISCFNALRDLRRKHVDSRRSVMSRTLECRQHT